MELPGSQLHGEVITKNEGNFYNIADNIVGLHVPQASILKAR